MNWARTAGHCEGINPVEGVEGGLPKQRDKVQHFRTLPYQELSELMCRIEGDDAMGALALRFAILTAVRSGEARGAMWSEIDTAARLWTVPAGRTKTDTEHRVPLSDAALAVLDRVRGLSDGLVFESSRRGRPMSDTTLAVVLKRLNTPVTVHGFRSTFRDWAEERTTFSHEVKESALAHTVRNEVERAYRSHARERQEKRQNPLAIVAGLVVAAGATAVSFGALGPAGAGIAGLGANTVCAATASIAVGLPGGMALAELR